MSDTHPIENVQGGHITGIEPGSAAESLAVQPGDILLRVNGENVEDIIDVQFYAAESHLELLIRRGSTTLTLSGSREYMQPLGLIFDHPTFDIDIRRCNNLCEFCFVLQMAPKFRRTLYIKDDDYRYSFLFGHFVTLTNLTDHDKWRITEQALSPLYVSVHATDLTVRREVLRNATAPDIMQQLRWLIDNGIEVHTQIVVTPGQNDGPHLEQSIQDIGSLWPGVRSISVVPVGLTTHHKYGKRPQTSQEAKVVLDTCIRWQERFRLNFGIGFVYPTDEWFLVTDTPLPTLDWYDGLNLHENGLGMVRHFKNDWAEAQQEPLQTPKVKSLTLATATLFAPTLALHAAEFTAHTGVETSVIPVTNVRLGDTITVAGLLMAEDVINALKQEQLAEVIVLPRIMFDHPDGVSLDDYTPQTVSIALNRPLALVDLMGDLIDIIHGKPAIYFTPDGQTTIDAADIKKDGGWAVEKYL